MGQSNVLEEDDVTSLKNLQFYQNEIVSVPRGGKIDDIHKEWFGDWTLLEQHHGYVQWLFPLRESGMNWQAQPLSKHEAKLMRNDKTIRARALKSYRLILDFYGFVLTNEQTGEIARNPINYRGRFLHLNHSFHNYLRITRICKWLGVLGLEHFKFNFINALVLEVFKEKTLTNAKRSCLSFWIPTLRKKKHIKIIDQFIQKKLNVSYKRSGEDSVGWGDEKKKNWFTKFYKDELNEKKKKEKELFKLKTEVSVYDADPYAEIRGKFKDRSQYSRLRREKRKHESSDEDEEEERKTKRIKLDEDEKTKEDEDESMGDEDDEEIQYDSDIPPTPEEIEEKENSDSEL